MTHQTVGIDISKARLDAHSAPEGRVTHFSNDAAEFRKLIAWIDPEVGRVAYEPTGPWHRGFEDALLKAGLPLYKINPYQVRCFARSLGRRAKTDAVDARTLALMAAAINDLRPTLAKSQAQRNLAELQLVRDALVDDRTAVSNRGQAPAPHSVQAAQQAASGADRAPAEASGRRDPEAPWKRRDPEPQDRDPYLDRRCLQRHRRRTDRTHARTGHADRPRAASLAGLAPVTRESGAWKGRSFIQGGRDKVRRMLYMPALTAIRWNPDLKRKYTALCDAGKPPKVAITAVMRKLVILANVLVRQDRLWTALPRVAGGWDDRHWRSIPSPVSRRGRGGSIPCLGGWVTKPREDGMPTPVRLSRGERRAPPQRYDAMPPRRSSPAVPFTPPHPS